MSFNRLGEKQMLPLLLESALGFFMDSAEELEVLSKAFVSQTFSPGQQLPESAMYFVVQGTVMLQSGDVRVMKTDGQWLYVPSAIGDRELDPRNYPWAYQGLEEYLRDSVGSEFLERDTHFDRTTRSTGAVRRTSVDTGEKAGIAKQVCVRAHASVRGICASAAHASGG